MTIEQKRRELFEATFAREANLSMSDDIPGEYQADFVRHYWYAFNAALDAVVIELPDCTEFDSPSGAMPAIDGCRDAIESTGLGLKVKP